MRRKMWNQLSTIPPQVKQSPDAWTITLIITDSIGGLLHPAPDGLCYLLVMKRDSQ
ncbi:MAG TPA: hypothetical protein VHQ04_08580 [Puia sp.]|nr:hypothetical protein [Puia sp.]